MFNSDSATGGAGGQDTAFDFGASSSGSVGGLNDGAGGNVFTGLEGGFGAGGAYGYIDGQGGGFGGGGGGSSLHSPPAKALLAPAATAGVPAPL